MKVKCIKKDKCNLTVGNIYDVLSIDIEGWYEIVNDINDSMSFNNELQRKLDLLING
jgi:hypothetical protein